MFRSFKSLFFVLSSSQRRSFFLLQALVILMALLELIGIASIAPFMAVVANPYLIENNSILKGMYVFSEANTPVDFMIYLGAGVLVSLTVAATVSIITTWRMSLFATKVGAEIGQMLYSYYLNESWLFHSSGSSAQLTKQIATETQRLTSTILVPLMNLNARLVLAFVLSCAIFLVNPLIAIIGVGLFIGAYLIIYKTVRRRLTNNGKKVSKTAEERFKLMSEGFGGIKDVILLGRQQSFFNRFQTASNVLAVSQGQNIALSQVPRYLLELVAFGALIALVVYLLIEGQGSLEEVLPVLSVYALAGFKLLPAFQQMYNSIANIKGNISAFDSIELDLLQAKQATKKELHNREGEGVLPFEKSIELENISFKYPGKAAATLKNISLRVRKNTVVGLVGPSGSGKSTVIDVLMRLIEPQSGRLLVDGYAVDERNVRKWQNKIGFVAQTIFLSEGSIAENIAFGIPTEAINFEQVRRVLELAHLDELVESLDKGVHTKVGERGVQLSGGQRQRIGIARALYNNSEVLIFDEATSALDGITEKMIMDAIHDFSGKKTIIMIAHRLKTVEKCDQIFYLDKGKVVDNGTYAELLETNLLFKEMVEHS